MAPPLELTDEEINGLEQALGALPGLVSELFRSPGYPYPFDDNEVGEFNVLFGDTDFFTVTCSAMQSNFQATSCRNPFPWFGFGN